MEVKGTAFLARKALVEREFGKERFDAIVRAQAAVDPVFVDPVLATTRLPIEAFIRLNERIVNELYGGDPLSYVKLGERSAEWALGEGGPYRVLVENRNVAEFVASAPRIYRTYYDVGEASAKLEGDVVKLYVLGVPIRDVYFEHAITGYFRRGMELVGGRSVTMECVRGYSRGDDDVHYVLRIGAK